MKNELAICWFIYLMLFNVYFAECLSTRQCQLHQPRVANFSHRNLTDIPLDIPDDVNTLYLSYNIIGVIKNNVFHNLRLLKNLVLSNNNITELKSEGLYGLEQLCYLDLSNNPLTINSFPSDVFENTPNLLILDLTDLSLSDNGTFPELAFAHLKNLRQLNISSTNGLVLGTGFAAMRNLEELNLSQSNILEIQNHTFTALAGLPLRTLSLKASYIQRVDPGAFVPLSKLANIDLSENSDLGLPQAFQSLFGLQNRNITSVDFSKVNSKISFASFENFVLNGQNTRFMANICVQNLELGRNAIVFIKFDFFTNIQFPLCLKYISIAGHNILTFSTDLLGGLRFQSLEKVNLSGTKRDVAMTSRFKSPRKLQNNMYWRSNAGKLEIPASLKWMDISNSMHSWDTETVTFVGTTNLTYLDLSFNGIKSCYIPFQDVSSVRTLKINQIDCSNLKPELLLPFPQLEVLDMAEINLKLQVLSDANSHLLSNQRNLKSLNMQGNGLVDFHDNLFRNLNKLTKLDLSNNKLALIPKTLQFLTSLKELDLTNNVFTHFKKADRSILENLNSLSALAVRLDGNNLACSCTFVDFIQWIFQTSVRFENLNEMTCMLANGSTVAVVSLQDNLKNFKVKCVSSFWLTLSIITSSLLIILLVILVIVYRYRFNIKYWCLTKCQTADTATDNIENEGYEYDGFVAYNHNDYRWVCHTLRGFLEDKHQYNLCLHHRDFQAAEGIQQNIVNAVNSSRKIILVISRMFLKCNWGEFEIEMAAMRMVQRGRQNVVIVILMEDIPVREMPRCLLNMWKQVTFLLWVNDPLDISTFWDRLKQAMDR